jgi:hypothetical protein
VVDIEALSYLLLYFLNILSLLLLDLINIFTHLNYLGNPFKHNLPILAGMISYLPTILSF